LVSSFFYGELGNGIVHRNQAVKASELPVEEKRREMMNNIWCISVSVYINTVQAAL